MINWNTRRRLVLAATVASAGALAVGFAGAASADGGGGSSTVVVTPNNTQGWVAADNVSGGTTSYVFDPSSPLPPGALQLATDATSGSKADYLHPAGNLPLSSVTELGYDTRQVEAPATDASVADASYQLPIYALGSSGYTTLVYEPYENAASSGQAVTPGAWQKWNVASGLFWSSHSVSSGNCHLQASQGTYLYTLEDVQTMCPDATTLGFGADVGSNNPSWTINVDGIDFNGTTYNFQLTNEPTSKEQCKNGGYANLTDANDNTFRNQGQCVSYDNHENGDGNG